MKVSTQQQQHALNLVKAISALMFRHDPIQLNVGMNNDEYESQVRISVHRGRHFRLIVDGISA